MPPLEESQLDDVVLSIGEINAIMGSSTMEVTSELDEMTDHSADVSDPGCLGAIYGAEEPVYAGSGWTALRDQIAREEGDDNDHWVEQTVGVVPVGGQGAGVLRRSPRSMWEECASSLVSVDDGGTAYDWQIDEVKAEDALITQVTTQEDADRVGMSARAVGGIEHHRRGMGVQLLPGRRGGDHRE